MGQLRFLLAVAVIAFHSGLHVTGPLAVYSFFIMSGYAIFAGLSESMARNQGVTRFFRRRLNKLLPNYLLTCLVVTVILVVAERWKAHSTKTFIANSDLYGSNNVWGIAKQFVPTLTLSPWPMRANPNVPLVPPWWSVVLELGFYLICALLVYTYRGERKILLSYLAVTLVLHIYLLVVTGQDLGKLNKYVYFNFFGTLVFFALGNVCRYYSKGLKVKPNVGKGAFAALILFIFFFSYAVKDPTQLVPGHPVWGYLFSVYFVSAATIIFLLNLPQGRIVSKNETFFANHSYGIYVWQSATFLLVNFAEHEHWWHSTAGLSRFVLVLILTMLCSLGSSKVIHYSGATFRKLASTKS